MRAERKLTLIACVGAGVAALSGCSYGPQDSRAAYETVTDATPTERPLAQLPAQAGAVVAVLQSRAAGVLTQRVVLAGDTGVEGENAIVVKVAEKPGPDSKTEVASWRPTEGSMAHELDDAFPTIEMSISNAWNRNEFGPFGYAIGEGQKGVVCGYAWQYSPGAIAGPLDVRLSPAYTLAAAPMATSVRVRLCRTGLKEADFVAYVKAMQVSAGGGVESGATVIYSGLGAGDDALARAGAPPDPGAGASEPVRKKLHAKKPRHGPKHVIVKRDEPRSEPSPVSTAAAVPMPGGSTKPVATAGASSVNPLLAPLQSAPTASPERTVDDMPLPGHLASGAKANVGQKAAEAAPMPMPMPN